MGGRLMAIPMTHIGTNTFTGRPVFIDLTKHTCIVGGSGMGKSTILANLFIDQIRSGAGGALLDPHGDLADLITTMYPKSRLWDFIYLDPDAKRSIPLNPFNFETQEELELAKETFFTIQKALAGTAWGDESARVTINAIDAVCAKFKKPSPVHVFRFLADDQFRKKVLVSTESPLLKMFREQYDEKLHDRDQMAKFSPPINKVGKLMRPAIIPIIGQSKSLDFLDIMNKRRVMVCRLSKGRLGEEISQILGSLIVSMISIAALRREKQKDRPPFLLVVDEAPNFIHGGRFSSLLAEGRKYGISVVPVMQGLHQLPFALDILANCQNQIIFNASGEDAELMAKNWGQDIAANITDLPRYHFYLRSFKNNEPIIQVVKAAPPIERRGDEAKPTKLIKHSLERWGTDRRAAEAKIMKFLAS